MRYTTFSLIASVAALTAAAGPAFADCNAKADIEAAFTKQLTGKGWRHVIKSTDADGQPQKKSTSSSIRTACTARS